MAPFFSYTVLILILIHQRSMCIAQELTLFTSAYNSGMLSADMFSFGRAVFIIQPAVLPRTPSPHISGHIQSLYSGFEVYALGLHVASALPMNFGTGLSIISIGHPDYKSSTVNLSAGKQLGKNVSIGVSQHFQRTKVANEGRPWTGSSSIGGTYDTGNWGLSILMAGLMQWNYQYHPERFSIHASAYIKWPTQTQMYFSLNYEENKLYPVTGIRQTLIKNVELFGAFQWYPARYGLGFIIPLTDQVKSFISTQYHPVLGWSPSIGLQWQANKFKATSNKLKDN